MKSFKGFNFSFSTTACHQWKRHSLCLCLTENCLTEALDWDCRQWAETDIQELPPKHEEEFLYCAGTDWPERVWSLLHWDIKEPSSHNPVPCAPGWSCLSREVQPDEPLWFLPAWPILWFCEIYLLVVFQDFYSSIPHDSNAPSCKHDIQSFSLFLWSTNMLKKIRSNSILIHVCLSWKHICYLTDI